MKKIVFILLLSSCGNKKEEPKTEPPKVDTIIMYNNNISGDGNTIINGDTTVEY